MWCRKSVQRQTWHLIKSILRQRSSATDSPHFCVVGSGPAGFYTAQQIIKGHPSSYVDVYERLPVPFGLIRYGVSPDHQDVKNISNQFTKTASGDRCSFIGNVNVGKDITVAELRKCYTAVVLSYGSEADRCLGIPGEDLPNVIPAKTFVGWYNGFPTDRNLHVDLDTDTAVVLGHGNVSLDLARMLLTPIDILAKTDITEHSLEVLRKSRVKRVILVGRRGPAHVSLTIKELREVIKLTGCRTVLHRADFEDLKDILADFPRPRKRLTELLYNIAVNPKAEDVERWSKADKEFEMRFRLSPLEILSQGSKVTGVRFGVNKLEGSDVSKQRAVLTEEREDIECGLVLRSIGYKGIPIDETVPFDEGAGVIPNEQGRVTGQPGLYCSGWIGTGPQGTATTTNGGDIGKLVMKDFESGELEVKSDRQSAINLLKQRGVKVVSFNDWEKINQFEIKEGEKIDKPREKIVEVPKFIEVAFENRP